MLPTDQSMEKAGSGPSGATNAETIIGEKRITVSTGLANQTMPTIMALDNKITQCYYGSTTNISETIRLNFSCAIFML